MCALPVVRPCERRRRVRARRRVTADVERASMHEIPSRCVHGEKPAKSVLVCTRPFFHGHELETPGAACDRPLSLTRRTMATTQEVKLFGKWTFDDVEVRRYPRSFRVARAAREGRGRARARDRRALGSRNPARACAECIGMFTSRAKTWSSEHATDDNVCIYFIDQRHLFGGV